MGKSRVSVIIPTHNRKKLLFRAVKSVLKQTYKNIECIVVDDGSVSPVRSVTESFNDDRLRYIRHEQSRGASSARNTGIQNSAGDYVAFLDDDDEWLQSKIEKQVGLLERLPSDYGMVYCWMDYHDSTGQVVKKNHPEYRGYIFPNVLDRQRISGCSTLLTRRDAVDDIGGFDESLPRGNDGDFIRRICKRMKVDYVPQVLVRYYVGHNHQRITRSDTDGIRNAILSQKVKLSKFEHDLAKLITCLE